MTQELLVENAKRTVQPRFPVQEPLKLELQHFANCITDRKKPLVTAMDGVKALEIVEAAIESSKRSKAIELN
jgi:UDP-N-acetylglucosamine 3-dehydrogenase